MKVLIYSNEHEAWWRDNYCGYTTKQEKAGVFDYEEAHKCYPTIGFNRQDEDYFVRLDDENNMQETKLTPLETFELLCQSYVDGINTLKHKDIEKDYFYNEKYGATITDIKTGRSGKTADIETALKRLDKLQVMHANALTKIANDRKKLKALEIINKKKVNVRLFIECKTRKEYNNEIRDLYYQRLCLTQNEYNILKEVLL